MANEVFVSTLTYREHIEQQRAIQKGKEERKELTNPDPDDIPEDLVDLGIIQTQLRGSYSTSFKLDNLLSDLKANAKSVGAEYVFNAKLEVIPFPEEGTIVVYMGNAYKTREHR